MSYLLRRGALLLGGVVLAGLLAIQSISGLLAEKAPGQAIAIMPSNGLAWEHYADDQFRKKLATAASDDPLVSTKIAASSARTAALEAIKKDPLAPKAHALIALSSRESEEKERLLFLASQLNRRNTILLALVMEQAAANEDNEKVVESLDQILRVRPSLREQFDPVLFDALAKPGAAPTFARLLDGSSPWHEKFLLSAARTSQVQFALASIRSEITIENPEFDRRLIKGLANLSAMTEARSVYRIATQNDKSATAPLAILSWDAEFPPIDWEFADKDDFRGQSSRDKGTLEVFARPGQGGVIASRLLEEGTDISSLYLEMRASRALGAHNLRLQLRCDDMQEPFLEESLVSGPNRVLVRGIPDACSDLYLQIFARSLRSESNLRAELRRIKLRYN